MRSSILPIVGLFICAASIGAAHYLEAEYLLVPCPLCMLQRGVFYALAVTFIFGFIANRYFLLNRYIYGIIGLIFSLVGVGISSRQLWLQYYPEATIPSCSAGLMKLIELHPIFDALKIALTGTAECAVIDFTILGLSIAFWSFCLFLGFLGFFTYFLSGLKKRRI